MAWLLRIFGWLVACWWHCWWLAGWWGSLFGWLLVVDDVYGILWWFVCWLVWKISWLMRMLGCRWLMRTLQLNLKGPDWRLVYSPHKTPLIAIELKEERPQKNRKDFRELKITNLLLEKPTKPTLCNRKTIKKETFGLWVADIFFMTAVYMRECVWKAVGKLLFFFSRPRQIHRWLQWQSWQFLTNWETQIMTLRVSGCDLDRIGNSCDVFFYFLFRVLVRCLSKNSFFLFLFFFLCGRWFPSWVTMEKTVTGSVAVHCIV